MTLRYERLYNPAIVPRPNYMSPSAFQVTRFPDPDLARYARYKDRGLYRMGEEVARTSGEYERWVSDESWMGWDEDLDDLFGAEAAQLPAAPAAKVRPFKMMSDLFTRKPSGKSQAEELVETAQRVQTALIAPPPPPPPPQKNPWETAAKVGGVTLLLFGAAYAGYQFGLRSR